MKRLFASQPEDAQTDADKRSVATLTHKEQMIIKLKKMYYLKTHLSNFDELKQYLNVSIRKKQIKRKAMFIGIIFNF